MPPSPRVDLISYRPLIFVMRDRCLKNPEYGTQGRLWAMARRADEKTRRRRKRPALHENSLSEGDFRPWLISGEEGSNRAKIARPWPRRSRLDRPSRSPDGWRLSPARLAAPDEASPARWPKPAPRGTGPGG